MQGGAIHSLSSSHLAKMAWLVALSTTCVVAWFASLASAATINVTNTDDSGAGSLRQAIIEASPGDTIVLPASTRILQCRAKCSSTAGRAASLALADRNGTKEVR
jgi:hypothetical protein